MCAHKLIEKYVGKKIISARLGKDPSLSTTDKLLITFEDGINIIIYDKGEPGCNTERSMYSDDDISSLIGHRLLDLIEKEVSRRESATDWLSFHETMFVEIVTDGGWITLVNHNNHNGYYEYFYLKVEEFIYETTSLTPSQTDDHIEDI